MEEKEATRETHSFQSDSLFQGDTLIRSSMPPPLHLTADSLDPMLGTSSRQGIDTLGLEEDSLSRGSAQIDITNAEEFSTDSLKQGIEEYPAVLPKKNVKPATRLPAPSTRLSHEEARNQAYMKMLCELPATSIGAQSLLDRGDTFASQAFADLARLKRWNMLLALYDEVYFFDTDWIAREISARLSEDELAALPDEVRRTLWNQMDKGWTGIDEYALMDKIEKATSKKSFEGRGKGSASVQGNASPVDQDARTAALARALEYVDANPGKTYGFSSPPSPPGGKIDCSGLIRAAIMGAGYPDPFNDPQTGKVLKGMPKEDGSGTWGNGVALLVSNPQWQEKPLEAIEVGDVVTFRSSRTDHQGEGGKYDHIGIVSEIIKEQGTVKSFKFIHSSSSNGPTKGEYDLAKPPSWLQAKEAFSWDNPVK